MEFSPESLARQLEPLAGARPLRLAVALSGGADSAALLHALSALARHDRAIHVRALHVNHGLSAAAGALAGSAAAVARLAGVAFAILVVEVERDGGEGVEAAARRARYAALGAALGAGECLLTAHHLEDQAETFLLQGLRGAGLRGLAAMPEAAPLGAGRLLRPLLSVPRAALRSYAAQHGLPVTDDPMNSDRRFDRAYLRAALWPGISERWPQAARALARAARNAAEAQSLLDADSDAALGGLRRGPALAIAGLLALGATARAEALRAWLSEQGFPAPSARRQALIERELLRARGTNQPRMAWRGVELRTFAGLLYAFAPLEPLRLDPRPLPMPDAAVELGALGRLECRVGSAGDLRLSAAEPFRLARRDGGERIRLGTRGRRRALKDLLREARLPPWSRERAVLVVGEALAAVVLPHATWVAAEYAAGPGEPALALAWREPPAVLQPAPA